MTAHNGRQSRTPYMLVPVFIVLAAGLVTAGYFYHRTSEKHFREQAERQISAIAELKADELVDWTHERLADAAEVYAPLRERLWATVVVVGVLLLGAAGGVGLLWRQQRVRFYREGYAAAEALRESEAKYRTLVENIPQKVFMKTRDSRYVSVNESYARDLGIRPEDAAGKVDYEFHSKALADKYRADDKRIMETGQTEEIEERYLKHGKETWVQTVKTPVRDAKGEIVGLLGIFWDITERKRAQEELQEANRRLKELATTDELTGLWNRRRFAEILALELERAKRRHAPLALAMFDIDQFKSINDTYGHAMGDHPERLYRSI